MQIKHSQAAIDAIPAPAIGEGEDYARACMAVSEARAEHDKPKTTAQRLDAIGIEAICEMIEADMSYASIAKSCEMGEASFERWLCADVGRTARARESRQKSARKCDEKALEALLAIDDDAPTGQITRQREIASHHRWRARVRNPGEYGDKVAHGGAADLPPIATSLKVVFGKSD